MNETELMVAPQNKTPAQTARQEEWEHRSDDLREQEWVMGQKLLEAGRDLLGRLVKNPKFDPSVTDVTSLLELASKLGRLSTGLETERAEVNAQLDMSFRVELEASMKRVFGEVITDDRSLVTDARSLITDDRSLITLSPVDPVTPASPSTEAPSQPSTL